MATESAVTSSRASASRPLRNARWIPTRIIGPALPRR
jgi:hypothetical protein